MDRPVPQKDPDKLSFGQNVAYAFGSVANSFMGNGIQYLALPIYNIGLGVSASLIGLALGIPRILDALIDPLMGNISDNTRSRWGRRRPYIIFGGIACGIIFALLWNPGEHWSKATLFGFFFVVSTLYFLAFTVWGIPYGALGFELSYDYNERTTIQAYKVFFGSVFGLALPWIYKMCFWSWDKLTAPDAGPLLKRLSALVQKSHVRGAEVAGAGVVGIIFGVVILISAIIPTFCKEKIEVQSQEKINLKASFKSTFRNKPFLILTLVQLIAFVGQYLISPLGLYINVCYVFNGNREAAATMMGWTGTFYMLVATFSVPFVTMFAERTSKKIALTLGLVFTGVTYLSMWWFFTPAHPWWELIPYLFYGPAWNCCMIVIPSMLADVCDVDELETGLRREGMYGAINSWVMKMAIGAVTCITGVVVTVAGIDPEATSQTASALLKMRLMFAGIPTLFLAVAVLASVYYPITEEKAREVRAILDARKKEAPKSVEAAVVPGSVGS